MMIKRRKSPIAGTIAHPRTFVARLILAEVIAKRGRGPLERKRLTYVRRRR